MDTHVVLPADLLHCDGVDILIEDKGNGDRKVEDVEALGTERVGENLNGVGDDEWSEGKTVQTDQRVEDNNVELMTYS